MDTEKSKTLTRREFLVMGATALGAGVVSACAPSVTPVPQTVVVTKEIEKIITATPGPTSTPAAMAAKLGGVLIHARTSDTSSLDPHTVPLLQNRQTCSLLYSPLVTVDSKLRLQPVLAESWEFQNNTTLVLHLRQGVKWHDGTNFTSADVVYTFKRVLDEKVGSWYRSTLLAVSDIQPQGDYAVKITLKVPYVAILPSLWQLYIIPASVASKPDKWLANNAIGTGPWMLKDWKPDSMYTLVKNPKYFMPGLPYLDGVNIQIIPDETSIVAALRTGAVHHAQIFDKTNVLLLRTNPSLVIYQTASMGTNRVNLNLRRDLKDVRVRRALSLGMDRKAILDAAGGGFGVVSPPVPPAMVDYWVSPDTLTYMKYDPAKAKQILADYGKPLDLTIITVPTIKLMTITAELLADQWKQLGIKTNVVAQDTNVWVAARTQTFNYDVSTNLDMTGADPDDVLFNYFDSKGTGASWDGISDPKLDSLIEQGRTTLDPKQRVSIYNDVQKLIDDQCYVLTTFASTNVDVVQTSVRNYEASPSMRLEGFERIWTES